MTYTAAELNQTGIYAIINRDTGKHYIGSAARSFRHRWGRHKGDLRKGIHCNSYLQSAWDKYGEINFDFKILEFVAPEYCVQREQWWLDLFGAYHKEYGYNLSPTAGNCLGIKHSEETKNKCRERMLGNKYSLGRKATEETRKKLSEAHKGNTYNLGRNLSEEHKRKLSLAGKGRKINLGKTFTKEHIKKIVDKIAGSYKLYSPDGEEYLIKNLSEFCREFNLTATLMSKVAKGKRKHHKGWKCIRVDKN